MTVNISLISKNKTDIRALAIALENRAQDTCRLSSKSEADVGILFVDSYPADAWQKVRDKLGFPTILVSSMALPGEALLIEKPVKFTALLNLILAVEEKQTGGTTSGKIESERLEKAEKAEKAEKVSSSEVYEDDILQVIEEAVRQTAKNTVSRVKKGTKVKRSGAKPVSKRRAKIANSLNKTKPGNVIHITNKRARFSPSGYLVGYLADVITEKHSGKIKLFEWGDMWLLVDESQKSIKSNVSKRVLPHLTVMPIKEIPVRVLSTSEQAKFVLKEKLSLSIEDLLWLISPLVAGEALPEGLSQDKKILLNTWPNFTQYNSASVFLAVTSYWVTQPASINELAKLFGLSIKELAAFVTSCYLCDFLDIAKNDIKNELVLEKTNKNVKMRTIFRKMLTKLRHTK
ncbi:MAG: hypothetical protein L3J24_09720 [Xanthomonadales bacterium]|nr:hypothetical protein [Xanthomonadales bacterium]